MIPIVFSTDHNYVMPTGVTILSLLKSSLTEQYHIYVIIAPDVTEEDKNSLKLQVRICSSESSIDFIEIGNEFESGFEIRGISMACYYRLLIPWLLPQYDKVIYSDVDIIYQFGLRDVFNTDLSNKYFGGVCPNAFNTGSIASYIKRLGINSHSYINSGFLIINSHLQRKDNLEVKFKQLAKKKFLFQDQDIINIVANNRIELIDEMYNMSPSFIHSESHSNQKYTIHYSGIKPWDGFTFCWLEWWEIYKASIFYDESLYFKTSAKILSRKEFFKRLQRSVIYNLQKIFR